MIQLNFNDVRRYFGKLNQKQVDGFNILMKSFNQFNISNPLYIAYMLATVWHETAHTMQPIEEYRKGKGYRYGKFIDIDGSHYKGLNHLYYGRGYVQLTWLTNYKRMKNLLGIDLVNKPELALQPDISAKILIIGMRDGLFTGKSLSLIKSKEDFIKARRIINGTDKASLIAKYAEQFLNCLSKV